MDFEELKKLPPEERVRRLRKLKEERKKEDEAAEKLLEDSEEEIHDAAEKKRALPIPQLRTVSPKFLQTREEKHIFHTKRQMAEDDLETSVEEEAQHFAPVPREEPPQYQHEQRLDYAPINLLYEGVKSAVEDIEQAGGMEYASPQQRERFESYASAIEQKINAADSGEYKVMSEAIQESMQSAAMFLKYNRPRS